MRKVTIALLALGLVVATSAFASNAVRISQAYGGGGNSGAYYKYDYVELFNSSSTPVNISGWTIQYASATSTLFGGSSNFYVQFPTGATIPACGYYLIQLAAGASTTALPLPVTPDATGNIAVSGTAFKIGLATSGTTTTCATATWVDLATFNSTQCFETATGPTLSNTLAGVRGNGGMTDNDNNSTDFSAVTCNNTLPIHNSGSAANPACLPPTGACCLRNSTPGACVVTTVANCAVLGGIFLGVGVPCEPVPCITPTNRTTWGKVKTIYR